MTHQERQHTPANGLRAGSDELAGGAKGGSKLGEKETPVGSGWG